MSRFKFNLNKIFRKKEAIIINEQHSDADVMVVNKDIIADDNSQENINVPETTEPINVEEAKKNIIRTRLYAYVIKNQDETFKFADYDVDSGEIVWIEGKLFYDFTGLERVRWSLSPGSPEVFYGYIAENINALVSSVYVMNQVKRLEKADNFDGVDYEVKTRRIILKTKDKIEKNFITVKAYSVCGIVQIDKELTAAGYTLNRI